MKFLIITGMSGAGKSSAMRVLEDIGYYCVDNMPPALIPKFAEVCSHSSRNIERVALVIDLRGGDMFNELFDSLNELKEAKIEYEILFLDSTDETLVQRYKQTRRTHPLAIGEAITNGIRRERELLSEVRSRAKYIIDTTSLQTADLRDEIRAICLDEKDYKGIVINVISFGFKYGVPIDVDLLFDVRFLPNPYYVPELKQKTGMNKEVRDYVNSFKQTGAFVSKLEDMIEFLIPHYVEEGKHQLIIAVGCTGGKHRSVTIAESLGKFLQKKSYRVVIQHRDYLKER